MSRLTYGLKNTFWKDDWKLECRNWTAFKNIMQGMSLILLFISLVFYIFAGSKFETAINLMHWSLYTFFGMFVLGVIVDIKHFPLKYIYYRIAKHQIYTNNITDTLVNILIKNPEVDICYLVDYIDNEGYYPIFVINDKQYIWTKYDTNDSNCSYVNASKNDGIYVFVTEQSAINYAKMKFNNANEIALDKLQLTRKKIIYKKNSNVNNMNIKLKLKEKYNKPLSLKIA